MDLNQGFDTKHSETSNLIWSSYFQTFHIVFFYLLLISKKPNLILVLWIFPVLQLFICFKFQPLNVGFFILVEY